MKKEEYNLSWGESVAVRQAFTYAWMTLDSKPIEFNKIDLSNLGYPDYFGDPALVELTKKIIKRQIGKSYKYVVIANGATGGVNVALRALKETVAAEECVTRNPPYFRFYPEMIKSAGLKHTFKSDMHHSTRSAVALVDSLSNPTAQFAEIPRKYHHTPIVWDAVYYNRIYTPGLHPIPEHDVMVGSYSKFTGMNGLRVGWIATNNALLYERLKLTVAPEYCGISSVSTKLILETAGRFTDKEWSSFESLAIHKLNYNRWEWAKLEKYFGNIPVSPYGMFYWAPMDESCKKLMKKSGIIWSPGSSLGYDDSFGRINLGQDCLLTKHAVETVLKNDKRPKRVKKN